MASQCTSSSRQPFSATLTSRSGTLPPVKSSKVSGHSPASVYPPRIFEVPESPNFPRPTTSQVAAAKLEVSPAESVEPTGPSTKSTKPRQTKSFQVVPDSETSFPTAEPKQPRVPNQPAANEEDENGIGSGLIRFALGIWNFATSQLQPISTPEPAPEQLPVPLRSQDHPPGPNQPPSTPPSPDCDPYQILFLDLDLDRDPYPDLPASPVYEAPRTRAEKSSRDHPRRSLRPKRQPIDTSTYWNRTLFLQSLARLASSFIHHTKEQDLSSSKRLGSCQNALHHPVHGPLIQEQFVLEAGQLLDARNAVLPEAAKLIIQYGGSRSIEVVYDGAAMVQEIMWTELGGALMRVLRRVCLVEDGEKDKGKGKEEMKDDYEWDIEMGIKMGEFYLSLFPEARRDIGVEPKVRWLGPRGEEPWRVRPAPWRVRDVVKVDWARNWGRRAPGVGGWSRYEIEREPRRGVFEAVGSSSAAEQGDDDVKPTVKGDQMFSQPMEWEWSDQPGNPAAEQSQVKGGRGRRVRFNLPTVTEEEL
ncbi:hypothetical protein QBC44DRAFT_335126 [Cladorrhinum sp. PSN332]|nr:hypothetical protein QBC44DRAFT_335126 [Cladorrhinum sp. PSN332]